MTDEKFTIADFEIGSTSDTIRNNLVSKFNVQKIFTHHIGDDEYGMIVLWYVRNVVLMFGRNSYISPYFLRYIAILERNVLDILAEKESVNSSIEVTRDGSP